MPEAEEEVEGGGVKEARPEPPTMRKREGNRIGLDEKK